MAVLYPLSRFRLPKCSVRVRGSVRGNFRVRDSGRVIAPSTRETTGPRDLSGLTMCPSILPATPHFPHNVTLALHGESDPVHFSESVVAGRRSPE